MYTTFDFQSKKALKESVAAGEHVTVFQPGPYAHSVPENGNVYVEGPHFPKPHKWYATVVLKNGVVVKVK